MSRSDVIASLKLVEQSWLDRPQAKGKGRVGRVMVWGDAKEPRRLPPRLKLRFPLWQWQESQALAKTSTLFAGKDGPVWWVRPKTLGKEDKVHGHGQRLALSPYTQGRDSVGNALVAALESGVKAIELEFHHCEEDLIRGALVAAEMAAYTYKATMSGQGPKASLRVYVNGRPLEKKWGQSSLVLGQASNLARHLTNLPSNLLNPDVFPEAVKSLFRGERAVKVEIWSQAKLRREKLNLLLAVGGGSASPPHLIQLSYRPPGTKKLRPIAVVGKGITFDTGGLNLKPDSNMRWMKKDMGGAAAVTALAWWACQAQFPAPCDFYLAVAENSVSGTSFRPGDVVEARSGIQVEIHNTDAEGRLVLADALDVACEAKPRLIIDVATLTGAIKAGLGAQIAGLFGNRDDLVQDMAASAQKRGDWMWPMPLFRKYKASLRSPVADMANSGDGFGGAITAALFLENFVRDCPWIHLDIYAWKDSAEGPWAEMGASGQPVQALTQFLLDYIREAPGQG